METLYLGVLALVAISIFAAITQLQNQIKRLQQKIDAIAAQLDMEEAVNPELLAEINTLLAEGKRVKAIKRYRMETGEGLTEASDAIDQIINQNRTSN